jgi:DNA-binding NtrC family response regulator
MKLALDDARRASAGSGGVLICGESGSGRRMMAREIHFLSVGASAPFVNVDCGELDGVEAALFGAPFASNGDGARPGLDRIGQNSLLRQALGGTIFLAHVPEMPARAQARLARILRDGEVTAVENRRPLPLNLRLVASSDDAWEAAVGEGRIRGDLAKRCSAFRVNVPPLRSRREDIPLLATSLLADVCAECHLEPKSIDPPAMALLRAMPWRGNVSEFGALIIALATRNDRPVLTLDDVLASVNLDGSARTSLGGGTLREAKERFERDYIIAMIERHRGRIGEAAQALGIQRPNLYRKMRTLHVPTPRQT